MNLKIKIQRGMTLIEVLIVLALIAILSTLAVPNYMEYIQKARRSDAMQGLENIRLQQEKWRRNDVNYGTAIEIGGAATWESQEGYYTLTVTANSTTGFTATAVPIVSGAQATDACGTFAINQDGPLTTGSYADDTCWRR